MNLTGKLTNRLAFEQTNLGDGQELLHAGSHVVDLVPGCSQNLGGSENADVIPVAGEIVEHRTRELPQIPVQVLLLDSHQFGYSEYVTSLDGNEHRQTLCWKFVKL